MRDRNEIFIRLVQLFRDDAEMEKWFQQFILLSDLKRNTLLTGLLETMKSKNESPDLISALELLRQPEVAEQVKTTLKN
jgi:hypothetical protein